MVVEGYRARVHPYVDRLARPFLGWPPNRLSVLAFGLCAAARRCSRPLVRWTTPLLFLGVGLLIFFGGVFDVLDGEVARADRPRLASGATCSTTSSTGTPTSSSSSASPSAASRSRSSRSSPS